MDPGLTPLFQHILQCLRLIYRRLGVGHQHHRGHTTPCRSRRPGIDILLVGKPGVSEMHVHIHQSGQNCETCGIDHLTGLTGSFQFFRYSADSSILYQDIPDPFRLGSGVDKIPVLD